MPMNYVRMGTGEPLLMLHGLGGSWRSWSTILGPLRQQRDLVLVDLPGFGETPPLSHETSILTLADSVTTFLGENGLYGIDVVGSSMGARLAMELARRGVVGATVALDPGGFWRGWQRTFFYRSIWASIRLVRLLQPVMPALCGSAAGRTLLFPQFSPKPWALTGEAVLEEMRSYAGATRFDQLLASLAYGPEQEGAPRGSLKKPLVIGWGRQDRVCLPSQAGVALHLFPDAGMHWFNRCGHFPHWDQPEETVGMILANTGAGLDRHPVAPATARAGTTAGV